VMRNNALDVTINDQRQRVAFDRQRWFGYRHVWITIDCIRSFFGRRAYAPLIAISAASHGAIFSSECVSGMTDRA
jgi:hypothetical protein